MNDQQRLVHIIGEHFSSDQDFHGVEVGVWEGTSSKALLDSFPHLQLDMVDAWDVSLSQTMKGKDQNLEAMQAAEARARNIASESMRGCVWKGKSVETAARLEEVHVSYFGKGYVYDLAFIDACHLFESVRDDTKAYFPLVREGGLVIWHDYNGLMDRRGKWGVKRAVDAFCEEHHLVLHVWGRFAWVVVGEFEQGEPE